MNRDRNRQKQKYKQKKKASTDQEGGERDRRIKREGEIYVKD